MTQFFKHSVLALVSLSLYLLIYLALKTALADITHYPVKSLLVKNDPLAQADINVLNDAEIKIKNAINLTPDNAQYHDFLAKVYYLQAIQSFSDKPTFNNLVKNALNENKTALKTRPQWPYTWANIALMKAHLQQFDYELIAAIINAEKYGPWEIASNEAIAQAGFIGWASVSNGVKNKAIQAFERIHAQHQPTANNLLKHYGLENSVCGMLADKRKYRVCKI